MPSGVPSHLHTQAGTEVEVVTHQGTRGASAVSMSFWQVKDLKIRPALCIRQMLVNIPCSAYLSTYRPPQKSVLTSNTIRG